jgi:hypothetical protein
MCPFNLAASIVSWSSDTDAWAGGSAETRTPPPATYPEPRATLLATLDQLNVVPGTDRHDPGSQDSPHPPQLIRGGTRPIGIPDACASSSAPLAQGPLIGCDVLAGITAEYDLFEIAVLGKKAPHRRNGHFCRQLERIGVRARANRRESN